LSSLKYLSFITTCTIDDSLLRELFYQVPNIEQLHLHGKFSHFNLDYLVYLIKLSLVGGINEETTFNYDLFKNLCIQLEDIQISILKVDLKKLLDNQHNFSNLQNLINCKIEQIEQDAFSKFTQLDCLDLSQNRIKFIEKDTFSNLKNLQTLDLSNNEIIHFLNRKFIGVDYSFKKILTVRRFVVILYDINPKYYFRLV
jgi:hypothetical protein